MAFPILDKKPLAAIDEDDITALLTPLWQTKRETAKKLQGRIKIVFAFAKFKNSITTQPCPLARPSLHLFWWVTQHT